MRRTDDALGALSGRSAVPLATTIVLVLLLALLVSRCPEPAVGAAS